jgi:pimeloyl-ACP methyl ester carboxylesterase
MAAAPAARAATSCAEIAKLALPETTFTAAEEIASGEYAPAGGPRQANLPVFCRVALTVSPQIRIEVWLPKDTWNGRFRGEGGGGYAGQISYGGLAAGIRAGYATASTDTGHPASVGGTFALNPDGTLNMTLIADFAERSLHELVIKAKAVINAYYGKAPAYSYWNGCSTGGRQGLMAAQRFPDEYDGLVIGAPAINWDRFIAAELWPAIVMNKTVGSPIAASKLNAVTKAAVVAHDSRDGVVDGVNNDPRKSTYDPGALACKAGDPSTSSGSPRAESRGDDASSCLSPQEADAVRKIWRGPTSSTGERLWFGLEPGTPLGGLAGTNAFPIATTHFQHWLRQDPAFDWRTLTEADFEADFNRSQQKFNTVIGTDDANLAAFRKSGGKMIIWQGEADPLIFPRGTVNYFDRVLAANGGQQVGEFARLYMAPGVGHCGGGDGPNPVGLFDPGGELGRKRDCSGYRARDSSSRGRDGDVASAVCLSSHREMVRHRKHGRCGELCLRGRATRAPRLHRRESATELSSRNLTVVLSTASRWSMCGEWPHASSRSVSTGPDTPA